MKWRKLIMIALALPSLTSPAEFVMLIASILANYALLPRREGLCVLMMADD
jgi:hypothetical protein